MAEAAKLQWRSVVAVVGRVKHHGRCAWRVGGAVGTMGTFFVRLLCLAVSAAAAASVTITVQLAATTALIMGGTGHPLVGESPPAFVEQYTQSALDLFIAPPTGAVRADSTVPGTYNRVAVGTPRTVFGRWPARTASTSLSRQAPTIWATVCRAEHPARQGISVLKALHWIT